MEWHRANCLWGGNLTVLSVVALVPVTTSAVASAVATMESMTEFYLTSVWLYKPPVIKRIIDDLVVLGCVGSLG